MEIDPIVNYLLKSTIAFSLLFGSYLLLFRQVKQLNVRRFFLLLIILFAIFFPFISFTRVHLVEIPNPNSNIEISSFDHQHEYTVVEGGSRVGRSILFYVHLAFCSLFFLKQLFLLITFYVTIHRHSRWESILKQRVLVSNRSEHTFSFFGIIVMSERDFKRSERNLLLEHELVHVKQFHSFDLLLAEFFRVLHWFNPLAHIVGKTMSEVHKYIADKGVVVCGFNSINYQKLILNCVSSSIQPTLANAFSAKLIKNRFAMMTNNKKPKWLGLRYFAILPLIALLFATMSFQTKVEYVQVQQEKESLLKQEGKPETVNSILDEEAVAKNKPQERKKPDTRRARLTKVEKGVFLKDFELDINNTGRKFSVILKKGITYRFYIVSENEKEETVFPILFYMHQNDGKLEQINTHWNSYKGYGYFDYLAEKTAAYAFVFPESKHKLLAALYLLEKSSDEKAEVVIDDKQLAANLDDEVFVVVEEFPKFQHEGYVDARDYLLKNLKYPEEAYKKGIQGRVFVSFVVGRDGNVKNVKVVRGVHELLDEEAKRVVETMPSWIPGKQKGIPVNVAFTFPLIFNLESK